MFSFSKLFINRKEAYAFVHIMLMFIAAVTVVQTIFLARLATSEHKNLSAWKDLNLKQLCEDYDYIMENKFASFVFHWLPFWLHVPSLRQEMEYKVMERYFTHMHQLPEGFPFANYMGKVFRQVLVQWLLRFECALRTLTMSPFAHLVDFAE
jgi:hypothetical protein